MDFVLQQARQREAQQKKNQRSNTPYNNPPPTPTNTYAGRGGRGRGNFNFPNQAQQPQSYNPNPRYNSRNVPDQMNEYQSAQNSDYSSFGNPNFGRGRGRGRGTPFQKPQYATNMNQNLDQQQDFQQNNVPSNFRNNFPGNQRFQRQNQDNNYNQGDGQTHNFRQRQYNNNNNSNQYQQQQQQQQQPQNQYDNSMRDQGYNNSYNNNNNFRGRGRGRGRGNFNRDSPQRNNRQPYQRDPSPTYDRGRGRGNIRGRGRGRGRNNQQFVDTRQITSKQAQDRKKKFVDIDKPMPLKQFQGTKNTYSPKQDNKRQFTGRAVPQKGREQSEQPQMSQKSMSQNQQQQYQSYSGQEQYDQQNAGSAEIQEEYDQSQGSQKQKQQIYEDQSVNDISVEQQSKPVKKVQRQKFAAEPKSRLKQSNMKCSTKQFKNRMKIFLENNSGKIESDPSSTTGMIVVDANLILDTSKSFSLFEINKRTNLPDIELALKKFQRSTNRAQDGEQDQEVYVPRDKQGLLTTMQHIKIQVLDADIKAAKDLPFPLPFDTKKIEFIQIYMFLWDRMREMIKDITRLDQQSKHEKEMITVCEQISRFFILSINEGRKKYQNELSFDDEMNKKSLIKVMTPLLGLYSDCKLQLQKLIKQMQEKQEQVTIQSVKQRMEQQGIYISPNQPQITSYAILFSDDYRKYLYENIFVGFQLTDVNPLYQSRQIQQALNIKSALTMKNYSKYFQTLESEQADYLVSCLMVVNLHSLQRQISQNMQGSFRYMDQLRTRKGVNQKHFKNMLRLNNFSKLEYKQFLATIKAQKNDFGYICINQELPEDESIYQSPAYPFDFKLKRKYFERDITDDSKMMKRSQIVSRSWRKSNYIDQIIGCFISHGGIIPEISYSPIRQQQNQSKLTIKQKDSSSSSRKKQKSDDSSPIPKQKKPTTNQLKLHAKMQQIKRGKFLQNFASKLADLLKPDQTKEQRKTKGMNRIINLILEKHKFNLSDVFTQMQLNMEEQIQKQIYLVKFHQYLTLKKRFTQGFSRKYDHHDNNKFTNQSMSKLLNRKTMKSIQSTSKQMLHLGRLLRKNQLKQFNFQIFTDLKASDEDYPLVQKVLNNIFEFITGSSKIFKQSGEQTQYTLIQKQAKINMRLSSLGNKVNDWRKIFGADAIIFMQVKQSAQYFSSAISQFMKMRNCINISPYFGLPIAVIKLINSLTMIPDFQQIAIKPNYETQQFLKVSCLQLSPSLCLGLIGFVNHSLLNYRRRPQIVSRSLESVVKQICCNAEYVGSLQLYEHDARDSTKQQLLILIQQYTNLCLQQVMRLTKMYYTAADLFPNWLSVLTSIDRDSSSAQQVEQTMKRQYKQLQNVEIALKLVSPFELVANKTVLDKQDFVNCYFAYLSRFDYQRELSKIRVHQIVDILSIKSGKIQGNVYQFYQQIYTVLGQLLSKFYVIAATDFRFYLNENELRQQALKTLSKIQQKSNEQHKKLLKTQSFQPQNQSIKKQKKQIITLIQQQKRVRKNPQQQFKYERAEWLRQVKKKIKI